MAVGPGLHSRVVAVLKVGLPLVAVGLLASLFLVQTDDRLAGNVVFSPGDVEALGSGLRIDNPTFTGTTSGNDRFRFTAALVEPDAAPPERARITTLAGTLQLHNGPEVTVSAERGDLDIPTQRLDLSGQVVITTSDGYRLAADKATIDLRAGAFVAGDEVLTTGPLGEITSGSLHVAPAAATGEARRFSFSDGVRLVYDPPDPG
ncbi:LPS export ABC transporter periplasmic protein LptC [Amaricoccus sp.]|uniref:LPS export ABC transporter periplasmic protein LptC n=1 Tax=Amaricoccus sp. TaxID=1872485 RepID=UPI0026229B9A|nr:LPS export ABC transporter periplasmic protein LptC [Amaricoccus sp.]HRO10362.1 LPS export ABC transporter periplasmic protein LptC [Amaricoccus sp.]